MATKQSDDLKENACVVCFKGVDIFSVGQCDHPVCYECSTRMRVLCRQNECPICRQDMPKVIFTKSILPYNSLKDVNGIIDKKFQIVFETENEKNAYDVLLAHVCPSCSKIFISFAYLRDHVRRVHQLNYCDLCVDNLKIYSRERRCYTRAELSRHRKDGDPDNRSHRGHPLCEFCDARYMDNDELYRHLRRDHLYCHFCDADGLHQYYSSYDFLGDHFRSEHYLCEEGDCFNEKFTSVFRSEIDLKAHKASFHGRGLGKAGLKQARTLELEFTLTPRPRPLHNRGPPRQREEFVDIPESVGAVGGTYTQEEEQTKKTPELRREEDFPALGSESSSASLSLRVTSAKQPSVSIQVNHQRFKTKVSSPNNYNFHFPALDNNAPGGDVATTSVSWSACSGSTQGNGRRPVDKKVIGNHPPREDFPSLSAPQNLVIARPATQSSAQQSSSITRISTGVGTRSEPSEPEPPATIQSHLQQSSKTKKKKSKSGKAGSEMLKAAASSVNHTSTNGESKSKKNKKDLKPPTKAEKNLLNDIENIDSNLSKNEDSYKTLTILSESVPRVENREVKRNMVLPSGEDFPSLSAPPGFPAKAPAAAVPRWEVKKPPKPPPGLSKPPPGLPPPGFSGLNGGFPPLIGGPAGEDAATSGYITPSNFAKRNTSLVKLINTSLVKETLEKFKQISVAFRRGSLAAPEYYTHCKEMLGPENFNELFPELLALLPDIIKQQELWKEYKIDNKKILEISSSKKKRNNKLEACAKCEQILCASDLREHLAKHSGTLNHNVSHAQDNPWSKVN